MTASVVDLIQQTLRRPRFQNGSSAMEPRNPLRIAAVQLHSEEFDKRANLDRMETFVAQAARQDVHVVSFPEICITG